MMIGGKERKRERERVRESEREHMENRERDNYKPSRGMKSKYVPQGLYLVFLQETR